MNKRKQNGLAILGRLMQRAKGKHLKPPPAPDVGKCPHCQEQLGEDGIRGHDCEGLRKAVAAATSVRFDRVVLDVEILAFTKPGHKPCGGKGWFRRYLIPKGAQLVHVDVAAGADGIFATPSGKNCPACKGAKKVPMQGKAGSEEGAVEECPVCKGTGKEEPRLELRICTCAAGRFAAAKRGLFVPAGERFYWLDGKAPPMPADATSPLQPVQTPAQRPYRRAHGGLQQLVDPASELGPPVVLAGEGGQERVFPEAPGWVIFQRGTTAGPASLRGLGSAEWKHWENSPGDRQAVVVCPGCKRPVYLSVKVHQVREDGTVLPSLVCPHCPFHRFIRLADWVPHAG